MSPVLYASEQPSGFVNHITKVAIIGAGGQIGSAIVRGLRSNTKIHMTAISRKESKSVIPDDISVVRVSYAAHAELVNAMKGQQVLVISLDPFIPHNTIDALIDAAAEAGVQYLLPNQWSTMHPGRDDVADDMMNGPSQRAARERIESKGMKWINITCGFWYDFSLATGDFMYGFDIPGRKVTFFDEGATKIYTSPVPYVGLAIAKVLSLPILPKDAQDKTLTLSTFANGTVFLGPLDVSQRDMFASLLRVTGTKESDWTMTHEPSKERHETNKAKLLQGDWSCYSPMMYSRVFWPGDEAGHYGHPGIGLDDERLGMPRLDVDEETRKAVELGKKGYWYSIKPQ